MATVQIFKSTLYSDFGIADVPECSLWRIFVLVFVFVSSGALITVAGARLRGELRAYLWDAMEAHGARLALQVPKP